jgi:hypothetical protein
MGGIGRDVPGVLIACLLAPAAAHAVSATWGAEYRARYESLDPLNYGIGPAGQSYAAFGERFLLQGELRAREPWRLFIQLSGATEHGRKPLERGFDRSALDVAQAFIDVPVVDGTTLRVGRQEIDAFGNRLIATRDAANLRRTFDSLLLSTRSGKYLIDAWLGHPVANRAGAFDDRHDSHERFWGAIVHRDRVPRLDGLSGELFFFARDRDRAVYQQGSGSDQRRTFGMHVSGTFRHTDLALQLAHQFGSFAGARISANGVAADIGWRPEQGGRWRFGLSAGYAQGDRSASDGSLQTFDPLYPNLGYFTDAPVLYPGNSADVQPNVTLSLPAQIRLRAGSDRIFRLSTHDAVYTPPGIPLIHGDGGGSHRIGTLNYVRADWSPSAHLQVSASWVTSDIGELVRGSGGGNFDYEMLSLTLRK